MLTLVVHWKVLKFKAVVTRALSAQGVGIQERQMRARGVVVVDGI